MSLHFLQDVFQMTAIVLVSVINHYHINGLHLFWDILYINTLNHLTVCKRMLNWIISVELEHLKLYKNWIIGTM